jgi:hypothetical protein
MRWWLIPGCVIALAASSCSTTSPGIADPSDASSHAGGDAADGETETDDDRGVRNLGGHGLLLLILAARVADIAFHFDPTIDPSLTPAENAQKIRDTVSTALGGCGSVTPTGGTDGGTAFVALTVSFGSGCTLPNANLTIAGTMALALSKASGTTNVAVTFTNLVVNGFSIDGKATFSTANGSTFSVDANLTSGLKTVEGKITITGAPGAFTTDGNASLTTGSIKLLGVGFSSVHYTYGDCYPDRGSVTVRQQLVSFKYVFSDETPSTGLMTVTKTPVLGKPSTYTQKLPAYGKCGGADGGAVLASDGG